MPAEPDISDEAVEEATGRDWDAWFALLDDSGASDRDHTGIAAHLRDEMDVSPWWAQTVAVHYERARGLREVGEASTGGYQVSAQRTLEGPAVEVWRALLDHAVWGGGAGGTVAEEGKVFEDAHGAKVEVRTVADGERLRLWRTPPGGPRSVLEVRLTGKGEGRTVVVFAEEDLPSKEAREEARARWKAALAGLEAAP